MVFLLGQLMLPRPPLTVVAVDRMGNPQAALQIIVGQLKDVEQVQSGVAMTTKQ